MHVGTQRACEANKDKAQKEKKHHLAIASQLSLALVERQNSSTHSIVRSFKDMPRAFRVALGPRYPAQFAAAASPPSHSHHSDRFFAAVASSVSCAWVCSWRPVHARHACQNGNLQGQDHTNVV